MKITFIVLQPGISRPLGDPPDHSYLLLQHLYMLVYGAPYKWQWKKRDHNSNLRVLTPPQVDLAHMAHELRQQDWKVYFWRDLEKKQAGLIFGAYCGNLTAWLLANT